MLLYFHLQDSPRLRKEYIKNVQTYMTMRYGKLNTKNLLIFYNQHGHTCVQIESSVSQSENRQLEYFCRMCRKHYRHFYGLLNSTLSINILTEERIQRLNDISFSWSAFDGKWKLRFNQLETFYREHGLCNVPRH
jgi:hypothetical protein